MRFNIVYLSCIFYWSALSTAFTIPTWNTIDTARLQQRAASAIKCTKSGIVNSGFETGQLDPWTSTTIQDLTIVQPGYKSSKNALSVVVPANGSADIFGNITWCNGSNYNVEFAWKFTGSKNDAPLTNLAVYMNIGEVYFSHGITPGKWQTGNFSLKATSDLELIEFIWTNFKNSKTLPYLFDAVTIKRLK